MVDFTKSIRINLNLNQNELQDVVIQSLAAAPVAKKSWLYLLRFWSKEIWCLR